MRSDARAIIFDGDDTLWDTQPIFRAIIDEYYDRLVDLGFGRLRGSQLFAAINVDLLERVRLSTTRLGRVMYSTYVALCREAGRKPDPSTSAEFAELGQEVLSREPNALPGLNEALTSLTEAGYTLVFFSGGDPATQLRRLRALGAEEHFGDRTSVVDGKDDRGLREVLDRFGLAAQDTWIVGNSPRFEIGPGLRLGLRAVWMNTQFWRLDLEDLLDDPAHIAFTLAEASSIIRFGTPFGPGQQPSALHLVEDLLREVVEVGSVPGRTWVVGSSPRLHINPALRAGCNTVYVPGLVGAEEVEPIAAPVHVAFTLDAAEQFVKDRIEKVPGSIVRRVVDAPTDLDILALVD